MHHKSLTMCAVYLYIYIYIPGTLLTFVLNCLDRKRQYVGGWWSKIEVIQVPLPGIYTPYIYAWPSTGP